jgi:hypothetical protein
VGSSPRYRRSDHGAPLKPPLQICIFSSLEGEARDERLWNKLLLTYFLDPPLADTAHLLKHGGKMTLWTQSMFPNRKKNETSIKAHSKGSGWLDTSDASQFEWISTIPGRHLDYVQCQFNPVLSVVPKLTDSQKHIPQFISQKNHGSSYILR